VPRRSRKEERKSMGSHGDVRGIQIDIREYLLNIMMWRLARK
jgi:hypothetical protein